MSIRSILTAGALLPLLSTAVLAGGTFDLSAPENVAVCAAKVNDKMTAGDLAGAKAMDCFAEGVVIRMFAPGNPNPVMTSEGAPDVYAFIQGAFDSFGYVATQHLVGSIYADGDVIHSSVHATHVNKDGHIEIGNADYVDTVVRVDGAYKLVSRDIIVVNFSTVQATPVLRQP